MKKIWTLAAGAAIAAGGLGVASTASAGKISLAEGPWLVATTKGPAAVAGAACTTQGAIGHSAWGTGMMCNTYIKSTGAKAKHWTYLKFFGDGYNDWCLSDGYYLADLGDMPEYDPNLCAGLGTSGRIPLSMAVELD